LDVINRLTTLLHNIPSNTDKPKAISQHPLWWKFTLCKVHTKVWTIKPISTGPLLRMMEVSWVQRH